mmetsp:Transcript_17449/g.26884  ORF Transcript_17449/g.26884 Transcript_17449/m.26884 type:complete len:84 (+) Transcript_17449:197-448(+)
MGINPNDLLEKTIEEFKYTARNQKEVTDQIIEMRFGHYEMRRRKKLRILGDYIKANKPSQVKPMFNSANPYKPNDQQELAEIH